MDGREIAKLQEEKGIRPIVEDINHLKISFGHEDVKVLTPIVETKLRSAVSAARSLKLSVTVRKGADVFTFYFTYPEGFPKLPLESSVEINETVNESSQAQLDLLTRALDDEGSYSCGLTIIRDFMRETETEEEEKEEKEEEDDEEEEDEEEEGAKVDDDEEALESVFNKIRIVADTGPCTKYYTCKVCRHHLFDHFELHEHSIDGNHGDHSECFSFFLEEPHKGMEDTTGLIEGKISCNACKARLGSWTWAGVKCSCNSWIAPGFQFIKSKVDVKLGR